MYSHRQMHTLRLPDLERGMAECKNGCETTDTNDTEGCEEGATVTAWDGRVIGWWIVTLGECVVDADSKRASSSSSFSSGVMRW